MYLIGFPDQRLQLDLGIAWGPFYDGRQTSMRLETRWTLIDTTTWESRLENGDNSVLREMLIGYYLGVIDEDLLFNPLKNKLSFESHPFSKTGPYEGIRCEAFFYNLKA